MSSDVIRSEPVELSEQDVRHNVRVNVLVSAIFQIGAADMALAAGPLLVYLMASNTVIGLVNGLGWLALFGVFVSPFISRRFERKKLYMFWAHVPYLAAWGLIGLCVVMSDSLGLSSSTLLTIIIGLSAANMFFSGFVTLPAQEFLAACIPMAHRGRYTGYSMSVGALGAFVSSAIGGIILLYATKPMAFGWLYLLFWVLAQGGYLFALLAREPAVNRSDAPRPWSVEMLKAFKVDTKFQRVLLANLCFFSILAPCMTFVPIYGYKVLGMPAATAAAIAIIQQIARLLLSSHIGIWTDRMGAKNIAPFWYVLKGLSILPVLLFPSTISVYVTVAVQAICFAGIIAAFNPLLLGTPKPADRAGHYTFQIILRNLFDAVGMIVTGLLIDRISFSAYFVTWAALALGAGYLVRRLLFPLGSRAEDYS